MNRHNAQLNSIVVMQPVPAYWWQRIGLTLLYPF